jgi:hypothetical protein
VSEPNDKWLDDYLGRRSEVSQRYREIQTEEVPAELDATVLARAKAAIPAPAKRSPNWKRWSAPLALAASAVMVVAIVLEVGVQDDVRTPAPAAERQSGEPSVETRVIEEVTAPTAIPPAEKEEALARSADRALLKSIDSEQSQHQRKATAAEVVRAPSAIDRAVEGDASAANDLPASVHERVSASEQPSKAEDSAAFVDPPAASSRADEVRDRALASSRREMPKAPPAPIARPTAVSEPVLVTSVAPTLRLAPEIWLQQIRELRREGKVLEADEQWREFLAAYPHYEVQAKDAARPNP